MRQGNFERSMEQNSDIGFPGKNRLRDSERPPEMELPSLEGVHESLAEQADQRYDDSERVTEELPQIDENYDADGYSEGKEDSGRIEEMPYEEKVAIQEKELSDVESGVKPFDRDNTHEVGNYGEMKADQDLREKGYERISNDMVTDIDENGHQGLDGVYYNPDGHPQILIVDAKYGSASLNPNTKDGKQMSENWIDQRLDKDLGKEKADEIRMEKILNQDNVGAYVAHVREDGTVTYDRLDDAANVIEKDVKI